MMIPGTESEPLRLVQTAWNADSEAAFLAAYGDAGEVDAHREDCEIGAEILLRAGHLGWLTIRLERRNRVVITGAAGKEGAFSQVLALLESHYPCVCVETYREGLVKKLLAAGYAVDHLRLFKRVQ